MPTFTEWTNASEKERTSMTTKNVYQAACDGFYTSKIPYSHSTRKAYDKDRTRLEELFMNDLFEQFGVTTNPKKDLCYSKAWEMGHSAGLAEIANYFADLVELIK